MKTVFLILVHFIVFSSQSFANKSDCEGSLLKPEFLAKILLGSKDGKLKFSKENLSYFSEQRNNLRNLVNAVHDRLSEVEHATKRLLLAELLGTHVYIEGEPGGAKTLLSKLLFNRPEKDEIAVLTQPIDTFSIQLNQLMGDVQLTGYFDPSKVRLFAYAIS